MTYLLKRVLILNLNYIITRSVVGFNDIKYTYPYIISNLVYPLSLLFVVSILSNYSLLPYALAGGIVAVLAINGISLAAAIGPMKSDYKYKDMVVTTRTSPIDYMLGEIGAQYLWSAPAIVLYLLLDAYFHLLTPFTLIMTLVIGILINLICSSIAFWMAGIMKNTTNIWPAATVLSFFLVTISPTFYPYKYLPHSVLLIMEILPTTSASVLEQGLFGLAPMIWYPLGILIVETVIFLGIAAYLTRWREI